MSELRGSTEAGWFESHIQGNFGVLLEGESSLNDYVWMVVEYIGPVSLQDFVGLLLEMHYLAHLPSHSHQML